MEVVKAMLPKAVGQLAVCSLISGTAACGSAVTPVTQSCSRSTAASASSASFGKPPLPPLPLPLLGVAVCGCCW